MAEGSAASSWSLPHPPKQGTASRFNPRVTLVQFVANAVVIGLLIALLPGFELHASHELVAVLWLAVVFGVLSALVRPALEFVFLPYMLQSLGLVVVLINAALLALLGLTSVLEIRGLGALVVGAVVAGALGFVLESLLGLTPPVVDDASARTARNERTVRIASISERLRLMQLYGILVQYVVDLAFDWKPVHGFRSRMQTWLWRIPVPAAPLPAQVKVRLLLQDLGPTYVKLGQIISSQGRALPLAWEEELTKLQSEVRPIPYEDVRSIVTASLGASPEALYDSFDPTPLAAASLAQVHEASTREGRHVAVKVQRPNIHEQLRSDIRILQRGAAVLERRVRWAHESDLRAVVTEFGTTLLRELDYTIEAYNTRRLARVVAPIANIHVPEVEPSLSSDRVLTLEFVEGVKATDTQAIDAAGVDRQVLARALVRGAVQMVMVEGFFHADPHPGNVVVDLANARLTFLDAGMVGELDIRKRISFGHFLLAFRDNDVPAVATTLRSLSTTFRTPDEAEYRRQFEQRVGPLIDPSGGRQVPLQKLVSEALDVLRSCGYRLDAQLTLAVKAIAQAEAITAALVPEADATYFAKLGGGALEELVPRALATTSVRKSARRQAITAVEAVALNLPSVHETAAAWLEGIKTGELPLRVRVADLDKQLDRFEGVPKLLAVAIVLTGLIVGSAVVAGIATRGSTFRAHVADAALAAYAVSMLLALAVVGVLLWRLVRAGPRARRR